MADTFQPSGIQAQVKDLDKFLGDIERMDKAIQKQAEAAERAAQKAAQEQTKFVKQVQDDFVALGDNVNKVAAAIGVAVVGATTAATTAIAAFATDGIKKAADLESQMGSIAAVMSKTKDEVAPLKDLILELGIDPNLKVSTFEAADAIEMLARNGLTMTEIMDGAARSTVLLANATGADFSTAADIATDAMSIFNIQAKDMDTAVNGITGVTTSSKFSIDDYRLALAQAGGVAGSVGVEFDDFNATIAGIAPLFASGSDAGTSFKVFLQRLIPQSNDAVYAMTELGLYTGLTEEQFAKAEEKIIKYQRQLAELDPTSKNFAARSEELTQKISALEASLVQGQNAFFTAEGAMRDMDEISGILSKALSGLSEEQKNNALSTIFGTDAMRAAVGIADLGEEGFRELKATIGNVDAEQSAATRMDNLAGAIEILQGIIEAVQIRIGEKFIPVLTDLARKLAEVVDKNQDKLVAFFGQIADWVGDAVPKAIGLGSRAFEWLTDTAVPAIQAIVEKVQPFVALLQEKLGQAVDFVTKHWDLFTAAIQGVGVALATASLASVIAGIGAALTALLSPVGLVVAAIAALYTAWETNFLGIRDITDDILKAVAGWWEENREAITGTVERLWAKVSEVWEMIAGVVETVTLQIAAVWEEHGADLMRIASNTFETIWVTVSTVVENLLDVVKFFGQVFTGDWQGAWETGKEIVSRTGDAIVTIVGNQFDSMTTAVGVAGNVLTGGTQDTFQRMKEAAQTETTQMATVTSATTEQWVDGMVRRYAAMAASGEMTYAGMRAAIVTEFETLKWKTEAESGVMSDKVKAKYDELRDGALSRVANLSESQTSMLDGMRRNGMDQIAALSQGVVAHAGEMADKTSAESLRMGSTVAAVAGKMAEASSASADTMAELVAASAGQMADDVVIDANRMNTESVAAFGQLAARALESARSLQANVVASAGQMADDTVVDVNRMGSDSIKAFSRLMTEASESARLLDETVVAAMVQMRVDSVNASEEMEKGVVDAFDNTKLYALAPITELKEGAIAQSGQILTQLPALTAQTAEAVARHYQEMRDNGLTPLAGLRDGAVEALTRAKDNGSTQAGGLSAAVVARFEEMRSAVDAKAEQMRGEIDGKFNAMQSATASSAEGMRSTNTTKLGQMADDIVGKLRGMSADGSTAMATFASNVNSSAETVRSSLPGIVSQGLTTAKGHFDTFSSGVSERWSRLWAEIQTNTSNASSKVGDEFRKWREDVIEKLGNWYQIGKDIITGLWDGLKAAATAPLRWIGDFAHEIGLIFARGVKLGSPSRLFAEFGENIMLGLQGGLETRASAVSEWMSSFTDSIVGQTDRAFSSITNLGNRVTNLREVTQTNLDDLIAKATSGQGVNFQQSSNTMDNAYRAMQQIIQEIGAADNVTEQSVRVQNLLDNFKSRIDLAAASGDAGILDRVAQVGSGFEKLELADGVWKRFSTLFAEQQARLKVLIERSIENPFGKAQKMMDDLIKTISADVNQNWSTVNYDTIAEQILAGLGVLADEARKQGGAALPAFANRIQSLQNSNLARDIAFATHASGMNFMQRVFDMLNRAYGEDAQFTRIDTNLGSLAEQTLRNFAALSEEEQQSWAMSFFGGGLVQAPPVMGNTTNNSTTITTGDINNGMDAAALQAMIDQAVANALP